MLSSSCLSMISAQTRFRVCREEKPVSTFSDHALEITEPEHIGHRVEAWILAAGPQCGLDGALREHGAILRSMSQFDALHEAGKDHAVIAGDGTAAQ